MLKVKCRDVVKRPSLLNSKEPFIIIDGKTREPRSVVLPYKVFERFREEIEAELFFERNRNFLLSEDVVGEFREREGEVVESIDD